MDSTTDTPRARQLGAEIRKLRLAAGLSVAAVAEKLHHAHTHVSRWESEKLIPSESDLGGLMLLFKVTREQRDYLLSLHRDITEPNWFETDRKPPLEAYLEYERTARKIANVQPTLVPGLLQTADYIRAVMVAFGRPPDEVERLTSVRLDRQRTLTRRDLEFTAIVGEHALRYTPCDRDVLIPQLRQLIHASVRDNITLHVLPLHHRCGAALAGPFILMEFERAKPVLHFEHSRASSTITEAGAIQKYREEVDRLRDVALSAQESVNLIADIIGEMEAKT